MKLIAILVLVSSMFGMMVYQASPAQAGIDTDGQGNVKGNK